MPTTEPEPGTTAGRPPSEGQTAWTERRPHENKRETKAKGDDNKGADRSARKEEGKEDKELQDK